MRDQYEKVRKRLAIEPEEFALLPPHRHLAMTRKIIKRFTSLGGGLDALWWWESFTSQTWCRQPADPLAFVSQFIDAASRYWLVAEADGNKRESPCWIYDAKGSAIARILPECHHHEYYIVERKLKWLLCENHHNMVIACGDLPEPGGAVQS